MILFAYASNMEVGKFAETVPSAKKIGIAKLSGHSFAFNKTHDDQSSKSNIMISTAPDEVWGVLIELADNEKSNFYNPDTWSTGIKLETVLCIDDNGEMYHAEAFFALPHAISSHVLPYDWYHKKIVKLAGDVGLPAEYITKISLLPCKVDPDEKRRAKKLKKLGIG